MKKEKNDYSITLTKNQSAVTNKEIYNEKFKEYLEREIKQADEKILFLNQTLEKLREKVAKFFTKKDYKRILKKYQNNNPRSILFFIKRPNKEKLIDFYIEEKTKEIKKEIKLLSARKEEFKMAKDSYQKGFFTLPFYPCNETLYLYLKFATENDIPKEDFIKQIILLIKLSLLLYDDTTEIIDQMQENLNVLYSDYINLKDKKSLKAVKFILKKIFSKNPIKNEKIEEYLKESIESYKGEKIPLNNNPYYKIISQNKRPEFLSKYKSQFILKQYRQNEDETIITDKIIQHLDEDKLNTIKEAIIIAQKTKNTNVAKVIKRAIEDIISMEKYKELCQNALEQTTNDDISHTQTTTLKRIIKTYQNIDSCETNHYYLRNKASSMPYAFFDIKMIDILNYGKILEMLSIIKTSSPKQIVCALKNHTIYQTTYDNIIMYYAIKNGKICVIKIGLTAYKEDYDKIDFNIYSEELNQKIDPTIQKIYASMIENELDISFHKNESYVLLKTIRDK